MNGKYLNIRTVVALVHPKATFRHTHEETRQNTKTLVKTANCLIAVALLFRRNRIIAKSDYYLPNWAHLPVRLSVWNN